MVKRKFKEKYSFEQRKKEAANVRTKYPDRIPVSGRFLLRKPIFQNNIVQPSFIPETISLPSKAVKTTKVQVVVERDPGSTIPTVDKHRFLVPDDISVAHFMWIIRKRIQLAPEKAIFLFIDRMLPQSR
ncbi:gamma-aminobutyric acid receptor-associated protein-like 2 isoform X2 [Tachypleus tridentatus]|uniref:gamma-aminobutyric acid receptor-associated protein-like 2 isoform X2 n=1 Tax=Tachypleus tridentatus TaxID=6853 RepID=UPI003FCF316F